MMSAENFRRMIGSDSLEKNMQQVNYRKQGRVPQEAKYLGISTNIGLGRDKVFRDYMEKLGVLDIDIDSYEY